MEQELPVRKKKNSKKERKYVIFHKISKGEMLLKGNVSESLNIYYRLFG